MERLTTRNSEGIGVLKHPYQCERCGDLQWSLPDLGNGSPTDRLAEYEDIGLTPEQLREIDRLYAEKCKELAELEKKSFSGIEMVKIWANLQKLKEYQNLEGQGKLLQLPCAVGDTVYRINKGAKEPIILMKVCEVGVISLKFGRFVMQIICRDELDNGETHYLSTDFGKAVFLTREEAEAVLKELEGGKGK